MVGVRSSAFVPWVNELSDELLTQSRPQLVPAPGRLGHEIGSSGPMLPLGEPAGFQSWFAVELRSPFWTSNVPPIRFAPDAETKTPNTQRAASRVSANGNRRLRLSL